MIDKILIGTQNPDKLKEIQEILAQFPIPLISLSQFKNVPDVEENGTTYYENALLKAKAFYKLTGIPCIADDTGLEVEALGCKPGIHSARWAGVQGKERYKANNQKLLREMQGIPMEKRNANFICVVVLVDKEEVLLSCKGICPGRILTQPRGKGGFGYDPLFETAECKKTFAELGDDVKNKISHRARAFQQFVLEFAKLATRPAN